VHRRTWLKTVLTGGLAAAAGVAGGPQPARAALSCRTRDDELLAALHDFWSRCPAGTARPQAYCAPLGAATLHSVVRAEPTDPAPALPLERLAFRLRVDDPRGTDELTHALEALWDEARPGRPGYVEDDGLEPGPLNGRITTAAQHVDLGQLTGRLVARLLDGPRALARKLTAKADEVVLAARDAGMRKARPRVVHTGLQWFLEQRGPDLAVLAYLDYCAEAVPDDS
jgi:hypothetical protein